MHRRSKTPPTWLWSFLSFTVILGFYAAPAWAQAAADSRPNIVLIMADDK